MIFDFLTTVFFIGLVVAGLQDLKRREIDNWLNWTLILVSFSYLFYKSYFSNDYSFIFIGLFSILIMSIVSNLFYYGRVFAGGDAKLLFAMSAFFVGASVIYTLINIGVFVLFLMISGSIYGLIFSFFLYFKNYKKVNKVFKKNLEKARAGFFIFVGLIFVFIGFYNSLFFIMALIVMFFPYMYSFAMSLESQVMTRSLRGVDLREGDWLAEDVMVGKNKVIASWEGLTKKELKILRKLREVKIKEGIPFAPAFLIAYILYLVFEKNIVAIFTF